MPHHRAAILVSMNGEAYSDPDLFTQILVQAGSETEEVCLIIGDSLNRWNLLPVCHNDMGAALNMAIKSGEEWCATFVSVAQRRLGPKFKGVYRWEEWRTNPQMEYSLRRQEFDRTCSKDEVIAIIRKILDKHKIDSRSVFVAKTDLLRKERGMLLGEGGDTKWQAMSWENAMSASILEYSIRFFSSNADIDRQSRINFLDFLLTQFFPNAYEHQAEEAVMLYRCLIPANIRFEVLYYPNKIAPIFQKAHVMFAKPEKLMYWSEIKVSRQAEDSIERVIQMYLAGITGVSRGDKEMMAHLIKPLFAFVTAHKQQEQRNTLLLTFTGLCGFFPQFMAGIKDSTGRTQEAHSALFSEVDARDVSAKRATLSIVHSPALDDVTSDVDRSGRSSLPFSSEKTQPERMSTSSPSV